MKAKEWLIQWSLMFLLNSLLYIVGIVLISFEAPLGYLVSIAFGFLTVWTVGAVLGLFSNWFRTRFSYGAILFSFTQLVPCLHVGNLALAFTLRPDIQVSDAIIIFAITVVTLQLTIGWCLVFGMFVYRSMQIDREAWLERREAAALAKQDPRLVGG